jgi:hypothetical protein
MTYGEKEFPIERVTKLDAARRQLRTAIRLFFEEGDEVSIYTLTAASHEILRRLVEAKGGGSFMKDSDFIKPESKKEYIDFLNRPQNFFKHADRDPNGVLDFRPQGTDIWLLDCVMMQRALSTGPVLREFYLFEVWFNVEYPNLLKPEAVGPILGGIWQFIQELDHDKRKPFFRLLIDRSDLLPMPGVD